jgi:hypothetical protein
VGDVPAVRASVDCGCVEFCLVWTPLVASTPDSLKCCLALVGTTGFAYFCTFSATCRHCPSAKCVTAANLACVDIDILRRPVISLQQVLY